MTLRGLAVAALLGLSGAPAQAEPPRNAAWIATVAETDGGHRIGDPEAEFALVEFVSYTCPACARFAYEGEGALQLVYIGPGRASVEIRHIVRDPLDLTATMLARCGPPDRFWNNHRAIMHAQPEWLGRARDATAGQRQRWSTGDNGVQRRAIAADTGLEALMERRGYGRAEIAACLNNEDEARTIVATTRADLAAHSIPGTPSFMLDETLLPNVHGWPALEPVLSEAFLTRSAAGE